MKTHTPLLALALTFGLTAGAVATPLGIPRDRIQVGPVKPVKDVVLYNRIVVTPDGQYVGWVENVEYIGQNITQVKVSTDFYKRSTWVFVEDVKFDPSTGTVVTYKTPSWIRRMSFVD